MNRLGLVLVMGSALNAMVLVGCGGDDSADELGSDDGTEAADEIGTDDGAETDESSSTDDGGEAGGSASTTSTTTSDTTESDDATDGGGCPDNPNATPCEACVLESCCEQLLACENSESCSCMFDCIEQGNNQLACLLQCSLDLPDLAYTQFETCVQSMCPGRC